MSSDRNVIPVAGNLIDVFCHHLIFWWNCDPCKKEFKRSLTTIIERAKNE
jgi:hypothetical protein